LVNPADESVFVFVVLSVAKYTTVTVGVTLYPRPAFVIVNELKVFPVRLPVAIALIVADGAEIVSVGAVTYPSPPDKQV